MRIISIGPMPVKRGIRRPLYTVRVILTLIFLFIAPEVFGQPQLLGSADLNAPMTRTPYGFKLYGRGFIGRDNPKRAEKSINWLRNHGAGHLVEPFSLYATSVSDYWFLIESTDAAWNAVKGRWLDCGGVYEQVARQTNPRSISVYIEPSLFTHPAHPGRRLAGLTDGRVIRASVMTVNGLSTSSPWLTDYRSVVEWEMGNLLGVALGIPWSGYANEIGSNSPCQ